MNKKIKQFGKDLLEKAGESLRIQTEEVQFEELYAQFPDKLARFSGPKDRPVVCFVRKIGRLYDIYIVGQREVMVCEGIGNRFIPPTTKTFAIDQNMSIKTEMVFVIITTAGQPLCQLNFHDQGQVQRFVDCLMTAKKSQAESDHPSPAKSIADRLNELESLKDLLSIEEYQRKRDDILRSL